MTCIQRVQPGEPVAGNPHGGFCEGGRAQGGDPKARLYPPPRPPRHPHVAGETQSWRPGGIIVDR